MGRRFASWFASVVPLIALVAVAPGCKGMGGVLSGLGKAAGGLASGVAKGVAHVGPALAKGVGTVGGAVARGVAHTAPSVLRATEAVVETAAEIALSPDVEIAITVDASPQHPVMLDPCEVCPVDVDCDACTGFAGYACLPSPAGASARCESSAPPDAPLAPAFGPSSPGPMPPPPSAPPPPPPAMPPPVSAITF
jgi:hypothetical protein